MNDKGDLPRELFLIFAVSLFLIFINRLYLSYEENKKDEDSKHKNAILLDGISAKRMGVKPENNPYSGEDGQTWLRGYYQKAE